MHELFWTLLCIAVATAAFHGGNKEPPKRTQAQVPWAAILTMRNARPQRTRKRTQQMKRAKTLI